MMALASLAQPNMNGPYVYSTTPGGTPGKLPAQYSDWPGGVESFDVLTPPMTTLYSQVWWSPLAPAPFPPEIVAKYNGSAMAIVGWEIDQVRRLPSGEDVSVPISASYNHHYVAQVIGAGAALEKVQLSGPDDPRAAELLRQMGAHGVAWDQPQYLVREVAPSATGQPTSAQFSSGNGGEYRKTFHGFAPGHALVIDSPTAFQVTPMQIDTWNRAEMNISGPLPPPFVAGPLPRASLAPADAQHSGLLECPMTTRLTKLVETNYSLVDSSHSCDAPILSFYECYEAAAVALGGGVPPTNATGSDATQPPGCSGCSVRTTGGGPSTIFNTLASSAVTCGAAGARCVCEVDPTPFGAARGVLVYHQTDQPADVGKTGPNNQRFNGKKCAPPPSTTILTQRNPTCDIRYYKGGQWACQHMWSLLDADQQIPWADEPLVFHHKYRFWVQPYDAKVHTPVVLGETHGSALLLGSPWEYDVPQCADGVAGCSLVGGTWIHTITGNHMGNHKFAALNNHCHAPTCLSMSVYRCAKGSALDDCSVATGELVCETRPVYGGTGAPGIAGSRFDEPGYIAIPDCFWGDARWGLELPPDLTGFPLHVVKTANATNGHYGEMSGSQPWVIL